MEGNKGTSALTFTVSISSPSDAPMTVNYATADGSATVAGSDYQAASGLVTFAPGETSKTIVVQVKGDRRGEYDESFNINLSDATGVRIANGTGYGAIVDNEPRISMTSVQLREGHGGTKVMRFTVSLSFAYDKPVTVRFATHNDTARTGNNDYVPTSGKLTFAPGQKTKTISVTIKGDTRREADESFYILLSNAGSNTILWDPYGWGTIRNDDRRHR